MIERLDPKQVAQRLADNPETVYHRCAINR